MNFQIFKLVLEKAEEPEIKLPTSAGSSKKQESSRGKKKIYFCFTDYAKAFDCVDHNKLGEILKEMGIPPCTRAKLLQLCLTLCNPMDCTLTGSSIHGILQARILEWVAIPFSRGIFPTQGSNLRLLHCKQILYHLSQQGSPSRQF